MKILIVDDDSGSALKLKALLCECPAITNVTIANTLADGLAKSQALQPDITLLDLVLPDSPNWSETVTSIRKFTPPVIVVTESYDRAAEIAAFAAGAEDVLRKSTVLQIASILISAIAAARMRRIARDARNEQ